MSDLYRVPSAVTPTLRDRIAGFQAVAGSICDQLQVAVPNTPTVLTLRKIIKINPDIFMAVIQDITRAIEQETQIRDDQQRFRAIVENVRDYAIYTVNLDGRVDNWNPSLARIGGWEAADVVGAPIGIFFPTEAASQAQSGSLLDRARHRQAQRNSRDGGSARTESGTLGQYRRGLPAGSVFRASERFRAGEPRPHGARAYGGSLARIVDHRSDDGRIQPSCGGNQTGRRLLRLATLWAYVLVADDRLRSLQENTWGHDVGDEVLITLVRICRDSLRESDVIFRWGGEEFLILLPETRQDFGRVAAERTRLALEAAEITHKVCAIRITVSIGVPEVCAADSYADDLIHRVDKRFTAPRGVAEIGSLWMKGRPRKSVTSRAERVALPQTGVDLFQRGGTRDQAVFLQRVQRRVRRLQMPVQIARVRDRHRAGRSRSRPAAWRSCM